MPIQIRHAKKVYNGVTTADLARYWKMTPQAAEKKVNRPGAPRPMAVIRTLDDRGRVTKEQKIWSGLWG